MRSRSIAEETSQNTAEDMDYGFLCLLRLVYRVASKTSWSRKACVRVCVCEIESLNCVWSINLKNEVA